MTRLLTLMRHGHAAWPPDGPTGGDDYRPLTDDGRHRLQAALPALRENGLAPLLILHSPLTRATQTAHVVAEGLGLLADHLQIEGRLRPGFEESKLRILLTAYEDCDWLMLVGHNPDMQRVMSTLARKQVTFSPGKVATVELTHWQPTLRGYLKWAHPA